LCPLNADDAGIPDDPPMKPAGSPEDEIAVFQVTGLDDSTNALIGEDMLMSYTATGVFIPVLMSKAADTPDKSPTIEDTLGIKFASTARMTNDEDTGETTLEVWIWNVRTGKLRINDKAVYTNTEGDATKNAIDALLSYLVSSLPPPPNPAEFPFFVEGGYGQTIVLLGKEVNLFLEPAFFPLSAFVSFGWIPFYLDKGGAFGFGLDANWTYLKGKRSTFTMKGHMLTGGGSAFWESPWIDDNLLKFRLSLGGGVYIPLGYKYGGSGGGTTPESTLVILPYARAGASAEIQFAEHLYVTIGANFTVLFSSAFPDDLIGYLSPKVGAGWRFSF
jgi:hypothetical protein